MSIKSPQTLIAESLKTVKTISPEEALEMSNENKCNLIDIRDEPELEKQGRIEKAFHISRGLLEFSIHPDSPFVLNNKIDLDKELVLFCAAGGRSALAAKTLMKWVSKSFTYRWWFWFYEENGFKVKPSHKD